MFRRKLYSQNFLQSRTLVNYLVRRSSVGQKDLVLDLGVGAGIISEVLLGFGARVIAVEIDSHWVNFCKKTFNIPQVMSKLDSCSSSLSDEVSDLRVDDLRRNDRLSLVQGDILAMTLPNRPYKVFSNIPFSIEGKIIRKLLTADNPPDDCYLVIRKDLAERLVSNKGVSLFAVLFQPFFSFSIEHEFKRTDFVPIPSMDCVLFHFVRRDESLLAFELRNSYWEFVQRGFGNGDSVYRNLISTYPSQKVGQIFQRLSISKKVKPTQISLDNWQKMFLAFF